MNAIESTKHYKERIKTEITRYSEIFFERRIHVDQNGKKQWVRLQYAHESHWDERNIDHYMNHPFHGKRIPGSSIGLVFFKKNKHVILKPIHSFSGNDIHLLNKFKLKEYLRYKI